MEYSGISVRNKGNTMEDATILLHRCPYRHLQGGSRIYALPPLCKEYAKAITVTQFAGWLMQLVHWQASRSWDK